MSEVTIRPLHDRVLVEAAAAFCFVDLEGQVNREAGNGVVAGAFFGCAAIGGGKPARLIREVDLVADGRLRVPEVQSVGHTQLKCIKVIIFSLYSGNCY